MNLKNKLLDVNVVSLIVFLFFYIKNKFHGFLGFDNTDKARVWSEDELKFYKH
jgi:hypothetical protein